MSLLPKEVVHYDCSVNIRLYRIGPAYHARHTKKKSNDLSLAYQLVYFSCPKKSVFLQEQLLLSK